MNVKDFTIDNITWNDLDMDEIASRIDNSLSSVGSEYTVNSLKTLEFDQELLKNRSKKADFFTENPEKSEKCRKIFKKLGKTKKVSFLDYIFKIREVPERSNVLHIILILLLLAAIALIFIMPAIGIIAFVIMIAVNIIVYFRIKAQIEGYFVCLKYLVSMTLCAKLIFKSDALDKDIFKNEISDLEESVRKFSRLSTGAWLITNSVSGSLVDVIMDYVRMIFHVDLMKFNSMRKAAIDNEDQIRKLYRALGEIELSINTSRFRKQLPYYCEPVFYNYDEKMQDDKLTLIAEKAYHLLVTDPVSNTIKTERPVLLTGSNASGKSTFLKTIAVNQILAQTIYTCLSERYLTTFYKVLSSMALSDNILGNESYFVVEIKSLKRIFDEISDIPVMCFIDEVLRGTNTIERISASSRILEDLTSKNVMVFAATHDIELTQLLEKYMDNYHFSESVSDNNVTFDYKLKEGPTDTSNAVKLLDAFGFDKSVVDKSTERADSFKKTGIWQ